VLSWVYRALTREPRSTMRWVAGRAEGTRHRRRDDRLLSDGRLGRSREL